MGPISSSRAETSFDEAHATVEDIANKADGEDRENDVGITVGIVLLLEKATNARLADEHFHRNDDQPRDS